MPNTRSSQKLERFEMIKAVADIVTDLDVKHTVDLKNQERTILIELHKVSCLVKSIKGHRADRRTWLASVSCRTTTDSPR
jgi:tRNA acetyltransferase TAN1